MEQRRHERVIDRIIELKAETAARAVKIVLPDPKPQWNCLMGHRFNPVG